MRYGRSWAHWIGIPLTLILLVAGFSAAVIIIMVAIESMRYMPAYIPLAGAAIGLFFFFVPCYALWTLLHKSVRCVDVNGNITVRYLMGKAVQLDRVTAIYIRPNFRTVATLVILHRGGETEINAPFEFKDPKRLFAALEISSGTTVMK
jgi:hypothetical protein